MLDGYSSLSAQENNPFDIVDAIDTPIALQSLRRFADNSNAQIQVVHQRLGCYLTPREVMPNKGY